MEIAADLYDYYVFPIVAFCFSLEFLKLTTNGPVFVQHAPVLAFIFILNYDITFRKNHTTEITKCIHVDEVEVKLFAAVYLKRYKEHKIFTRHINQLYRHSFISR